MRPSPCRGSPGLVLSVGIAVDANVLVFERIREELAAGKTVRLAVDSAPRAGDHRSIHDRC
jgi:preprotein translocase subunit SecD